MSTGTKIPLAEAQNIASKIVSILKPYCDRIEVAGSIRRQKEMVGDIEIVLIRKPSELINFIQTVDRWKKVKGEAYGKYTQRLLPEGVALDLFMVNKDNFGLQLAVRTGSADFSHKVLATGWSKLGYKSKDGLLTRDNGAVVVKIQEEEELFDLIGIPYVEPFKREVK